LRATIRERGTLRLFVIFLTIVAWASLIVAAGQAGRPALALVTLLVLAAGFEVVFATHVGVERVGRYIQHRYEQSAGGLGPAWEHTAMHLGRARPDLKSGDPLAVWLFLPATLLNLMSAAAGEAGQTGIRHPVWILAAFLAHALFVWRVVRARRFATVQREADLAAIAATRHPEGR
jgi:hypothetical protein